MKKPLQTNTPASSYNDISSSIEEIIIQEEFNNEIALLQNATFKPREKAVEKLLEMINGKAIEVI